MAVRDAKDESLECDSVPASGFPQDCIMKLRDRDGTEVALVHFWYAGTIRRPHPTDAPELWYSACRCPLTYTPLLLRSC